MPLHRNESTGEQTMTFKGEDTFVKENCMLFRQRVTVCTQISSDPAIKLLPEFVFKGKGTRIKVNAPDGVKCQWSESGSYRLEHMLKTIDNLPNRNNPFTPKTFAIYALDDYAVHLMPEIRKALWHRGYVLVILGGAITGFIQQNDTHIHRPLKRLYRERQSSLMLSKLQADKAKIPSPRREDMMEMLLSVWSKIEVDTKAAFKSLFVTTALDGSEDYLVSDRLFRLVGEDMKLFRDGLIQSEMPATLQEMIRKLLPPKGIRREKIEGAELLDFMEEEVSIDNEERGSTTDDLDAVSESDVSDVDEAVEPAENTVDAPFEPQPMIIHNTASLSNLYDDDSINKNARFLDELTLLFNKHETSETFLPHLKKLQNVYNEARRSLRKRIENKKKEIKHY